jgi:hypothetical protein
VGGGALLLDQCDVEEVFGVDEVAVVVVADFHADAVDGAGEGGVVGIVVGDGAGGVTADVGGFLGGEQRRLGAFDAAGGDLVAVGGTG